MDLKDYGIIMWEDEKIASFREKLLAWYDANKSQRLCSSRHVSIRLFLIISVF